MAPKGLRVPIDGDPSGLLQAFSASEFAAGSWGDKIQQLAGKSSAALAVGGVAIGAVLYKVGSDFDEAYDQIRTATGATGSSLDGLKDDFKAVVSNVPASFGDASTAISTINQKLGLTGAPLQGLSEQFLELSRITKTDLGGNVEAVTGLFNNFGIGAQDQGAKLDELFRTSQATGVSVGDLATQMSGSGAVLRSVGLDFDQSAALLGTLGKAGLDAGDVMPALSKSMALAAKDGKSAGDVFSEAFAAIQSAPDATAAAGVAVDVFGAKAGPKFAEMIRSGQLSYGDLLGQIQGGSDTIIGAGQDTQDFQEKFELMKNKAFVALEPIATKVFGLVGEGMGFIADHASVIVPLVIGVAGAFLAWKAATLAWNAVSEVATAIQWAWNAAMNANPIMIVVLAVAALAAAVVWAYNNVSWFHDGVVAVWDGIQAAASWAWDNVLKPIFDNWEIAITVLMGPLGLLVAVVVDNWDRISAAISWAWNNVIQPVFSAIWDWVQGTLIPGFQMWWQVIQAVWNGIATAASWAWNNVILPVFSAVWGWVQGTLIPGFQMWWQVVQAVWNGISAAISWAWGNVIQPIWAQIQQVISGVLIPAFQVAQTVIGAVWSGISSAISSAWGGIQTVFGWLTGAIDSIKGAFSSIADTVRSVFDGLAGIVSSAFQGIKNAWNNTVGGLGISIPGFLGFGGIDLTIPRLHTGGVFNAPVAGGQGFALLRDGERVLTPTANDTSSAAGGVTYINVTFGDIYQQPGEDGAEFAHRVREGILTTVRNDGPLPVAVIG